MLVSDFFTRLMHHEYRVMFLMWVCEVIMVCGKRWEFDCGVCALIHHRSLLGISMYHEHRVMLLMWVCEVKMVVGS